VTMWVETKKARAQVVFLTEGSSTSGRAREISPDRVLGF